MVNRIKNTFGFILAAILIILLIVFIRQVPLIMMSAITIVCTTISCIYASLSVEKVTGEKMSVAVWPFKLLFHGAFVILSWNYFNNPWVYITMLAILSALSILNTEGAHRRLSWKYLIIQYAIVLCFAVANYADRNGEVFLKIRYLLWIAIPVLVAFICNEGISAFLNRLRSKQETVATAAKVVSRKVVRKLDNLAEQSSSN